MPSRAATSDWSNFAFSRRPRIKSRRILRSLCLRAGRADFRAIGREYTGVLTYIPKWTSTYWTIHRYVLLLDCWFGVCSKHGPAGVDLHGRGFGFYLHIIRDGVDGGDK